MDGIEPQHIEIPKEAKYVGYLVPRVTEEVRKALLEIDAPEDSRKIRKTWEAIRRYNANGRAYGVQFRISENDGDILPKTYVISGEVKAISDLKDETADDEFEAGEVAEVLGNENTCTHYIKTQLGEILAFDPKTMMIVGEEK